MEEHHNYPYGIETMVHGNVKGKHLFSLQIVDARSSPLSVQHVLDDMR